MLMRRASRRPFRRRCPLYWSDLVVVFVLYTVGFLVTGLQLGGDEARDVAAANVGAVVAAGLGLGARLVWRAYRS
jgi:hypothetical protein